MASLMWKLNTSNQNKFEEFKRLFAQYGCSLEASHLDLKEIDADPLQVIAHKASQVEEHVLVEDTSLEIEGASIGIHVRWLLEHLRECIGRQSHWKVLLAYRRENKVFVYKGSISGTIVEPRGASEFGFDPFFLPNKAAETLAESKPDQFNARAKAVEALMKNKVWMICPTINKWEGSWQRA